MSKKRESQIQELRKQVRELVDINLRIAASGAQSHRALTEAIKERDEARQLAKEFATETVRLSDGITEALTVFSMGRSLFTELGKHSSNDPMRFCALAAQATWQRAADLLTAYTTKTNGTDSTGA